MTSLSHTCARAVPARRRSRTKAAAAARRRITIDLGKLRGIREAAAVTQEALLTDEERRVAAYIFKALSLSVPLQHTREVREVRDFVVNTLNAIPGLQVQYYSIVDGQTLADVGSWGESDDIVGCITVYCGSQPIRLIDHIRYK